jgi:ribonucleotide reductase beta subunit family protein with ferritin-like domain
MCEYIEFVADIILLMLGYQKHWNTPLPPALKFMEKISFNGMTNFFEKQVGEYSLGGIGEDKKKIEIDDDF